MRKIQSQIDSRLLYTGKVSGQNYEWDKAGNIQDVQEEDVEELLAKRIGVRSCCGAGAGNKVFELIMEDF